jgi:preprotein translocase subunit SecE
MWTRLKSYLYESIQEFRRVNWPTRKETIRLTLIVVALSLVVAVYLGLLDSIFVYLLENFVI